MTKFVIKAQDGSYLKLTPADVEYNTQHLKQHGTLRIGAQFTKTAYNYKTRTAADSALAIINEFIKQCDSTADQRAQYPSEWRFYKYIDRQKGCVVEEL